MIILAVEIPLPRTSAKEFPETSVLPSVEKVPPVILKVPLTPLPMTKPRIVLPP